MLYLKLPVRSCRDACVLLVASAVAHGSIVGCSALSP